METQTTGLRAPEGLHLCKTCPSRRLVLHDFSGCGWRESFYLVTESVTVCMLVASKWYPARFSFLSVRWIEATGKATSPPEAIVTGKPAYPKLPSAFSQCQSRIARSHSSLQPATGKQRPSHGDLQFHLRNPSQSHRLASIPPATLPVHEPSSPFWTSH